MKHPTTWRPYISPTHAHYNTENFSYYLILRRTYWPTTKITCDVPGAELSHILLTWDTECSSCLSFRLKNKQKTINCTWIQGQDIYSETLAGELECDRYTPAYQGAVRLEPPMSTSVPAADATAYAQGKSYNSWPRDTHIWIPMTPFIQITLPSSK